MKWIFPKRQDQEIVAQTDWQNEKTWADFNASLPENDGGVCIVEGVEISACAGQQEADDDISKDRVKRFDDPDSMLESLKKPW